MKNIASGSNADDILIAVREMQFQAQWRKMTIVLETILR